MNIQELTVDEILLELNRINNSKQGTINGIRGSSILYNLLHEELDHREYEGDRPPREYQQKLGTI